MLLRRIALALALGASSPVIVRADATPPSVVDRAAPSVFGDSAMVAVARPAALVGTLARLGSGWPDLVRRVLRVPAAVNPLDPSVLSMLGVDPAASSWVAVRPLRGGVHVRVALALTEARVAEALVRTAAAVLHVELMPGTPGVWQGTCATGEPMIARLGNDVLVVDWVQPGSTAAPTTADLLRIIPLKPPRAWKSGRGSSRRIGPEDAFAVWIDLAMAGTLSIGVAERVATQALHGASASDRPAIVRAARAELLSCRHRLDEPASFDDVTASLAARRGGGLGVVLAFGGKRAALDALHGRALELVPQPTLAVEPDAQLRVRAGLANKGRTLDRPTTCGNWSQLVWTLRNWARVVATSELGPLLTSIGGGALALPRRDHAPALTAGQLLGVLAVDSSPRADVEHWLAKQGAPVAGDVKSSTGEVLIMVGDKDLVRTMSAQGPFPTSPLQPPGALATFSSSSRGLERILAARPELATSFDGVDRIDATLLSDGESLRVEAQLGLQPANGKKQQAR